MSILVSNGLVFYHGEFVSKDLLIEEDKILKVGGGGVGLKGDERIDASGLVVLPGFIDPHVHFREPGATYKEDFYTGSHAAVAGGFTTVFDMPNNSIPTITKARFEEKRRLAKKAICDVCFHFGGTDDNFEEIAKAKPDSLKLYLGKTTGDLFLTRSGSLERHFREFPKNKQIVLHASDHNEDASKNFANTISLVQRSVLLAKKIEKIGRKIHLAHASTAEEIQISNAYENCTVEVTPHHLFLSAKDLDRLRKCGKVYPPLRSEQQRSALYHSLTKVNCIATDHAPHTLEDKENRAAGFPGLETCFSLMLRAYYNKDVSLEWIVEAMTSNVADIFGLNDPGRLVEGSCADVALVDLKKEWTVKGEELETKCKWSPFEGMRLKGRVKTVIKNGEVIYDAGSFYLTNPYKKGDESGKIRNSNRNES